MKNNLTPADFESPAAVARWIMRLINQVFDY